MGLVHFENACRSSPSYFHTETNDAVDYLVNRLEAFSTSIVNGVVMLTDNYHLAVDSPLLEAAGCRTPLPIQPHQYILGKLRVQASPSLPLRLPRSLTNFTVCMTGILRTWAAHPKFVLAALKVFMNLAHCQSRIAYGKNRGSNSIHHFIARWGTVTTIANLLEAVSSSPPDTNHREALLLQVMEAIKTITIPKSPTANKPLLNAGLHTKLLSLIKHEQGYPVLRKAYVVLCDLIPYDCGPRFSFSQTLPVEETVRTIVSNLRTWSNPSKPDHVSIQIIGWRLVVNLLACGNSPYLDVMEMIDDLDWCFRIFQLKPGSCPMF